MQRFAKNYLPILFNLYTSVDSMTPEELSSWKDFSGAVLETVRIYIELTPDDLITRYANSAIEKAQKDNSPVLKKVIYTNIFSSNSKKFLLTFCTRNISCLYHF